MWAQYKKTFVMTQIVICVLTLVIYFETNRVLALAALYFVMMQLGSVLGAGWALRLRKRVERRSS